MLMVGAGAMAPHLIMAMKAVRPSLEVVRIWNRTPERASALARRLAIDSLAVEATGDLEETARKADIISCATMASDPLIRGAWLAKGAHLDLVGSYQTHMRESDDDCVRRARIYMDSRMFTLHRVGDISQPLEAGIITEDDVAGDLFDLSRGTVVGRRNADEITLFKNSGGGTPRSRHRALAAGEGRRRLTGPAREPVLRHRPVRPTRRSSQDIATEGSMETADPRKHLVCAIDTTCTERASSLVSRLEGHVGAFKFGMEFFYAHGAASVRTVAGEQVRIFLDLKLNDIPATVAGGLRALLPLAPFMTTVHATGGPDMMRAAMEAVAPAGDARPKVLAVTVLTSMDDDDVEVTGGRGSVRDQVLRLTELALDTGVDGRRVFTS